LFEWARFPEVPTSVLDRLLPDLSECDPLLRGEVMEDAHYAPYLERQTAEVRDLRANESIMIPSHLDFGAIGGLSREMQERLEAARPETLAAAGRIRGITPAALAAILVHVRRRAA
ncbi:MAG: tRNA uridine-5-carboxymethylaminomethyl(34) synthesis enzyme MnmG, partial [Sphingobium sp.]